MFEYIIQTCPKCGADLEHIVYTTYPPIPAWQCPKCGWRYEQQVKIERVPWIYADINTIIDNYSESPKEEKE